MSALVTLVGDHQANAEVKAVYDDIRATRNTEWVNNFWRALANDPALLRRVWTDMKETMAEGELDSLTKELIYVAVSVANGCEYCIRSHSRAARKKGMTEGQLQELLAVVALASRTNSLAEGYQVPVDDAFK